MVSSRRWRTERMLERDRICEDVAVVRLKAVPSCAILNE